MVNWQVTATTIYCDAVDDEVTIMVYKDWSVRCTGFDRYFKPDREAARALERRGRGLKRSLACEGLGCHRVTGYREKLRLEETSSRTG